jgi:hypothetical protein
LTNKLQIIVVVVVGGAGGRQSLKYLLIPGQFECPGVDSIAGTGLFARTVLKGLRKNRRLLLYTSHYHMNK